MPQTARQFRKFIRIINYDRNFVDKLSDKLIPLYGMINKNTRKLNWNEIQKSAFDDIKKIWAKNPELRMQNFNKKIILETRASNVELKAVLKKRELPTSYVSRVLKAAEKNYTIIEKELLTENLAIVVLEYYHFGREFDLLTDHKALLSIKNKSGVGT